MIPGLLSLFGGCSVLNFETRKGLRIERYSGVRAKRKKQKTVQTLHGAKELLLGSCVTRHATPPHQVPVLPKNSFPSLPLSTGGVTHMSLLHITSHTSVFIISLSIHLSIYLSVCLFIHHSTCHSISHLSLYLLSVNVSVVLYQSTALSFYLSVILSVYQFVFGCICIHVCLSFSIYHSFYRSSICLSIIL